MAPLSRKEQRGLRSIERGLCSDDPVLARLLSEPEAHRGEQPAPRARRPAFHAAVSMASLGMVQFLSGLAADERQMMWAGVLVLALTPFITVLVLAASRNDTS